MKGKIFKDYRVKIGGGILAIIALHFAFQFFFIQNENLQMVQNLATSEQFEEVEKPSEKVADVAGRTDISTVAEESETVEEEITEAKEPSEIKTIYKPKKVETVKKQKVVSPSVQFVQPKPKAKSTQTVIKKRIPQQTTAERLRRAERLLTGA